MKKQRGITLSGLIIVLVLVGIGALLGFKLFTPYVQYFTIQKTFKAMVQNPSLKGGSRQDFLKAYQRYTMIDNVTAISEDDIEIAKDGDKLVISANYSVRVPLVANVSLLIDLAPSSGSK